MLNRRALLAGLPAIAAASVVPMAIGAVRRPAAPDDDAELIRLADECDRYKAEVLDPLCAKTLACRVIFDRQRERLGITWCDADLERIKALDASTGHGPAGAAEVEAWDHFATLEQQARMLHPTSFKGLYAKSRIAGYSIHYSDTVPREDQDWDALVFNELMDDLKALGA